MAVEFDSVVMVGVARGMRGIPEEQLKACSLAEDDSLILRVRHVRIRGCYSRHNSNEAAGVPTED